MGNVISKTSSNSRRAGDVHFYANTNWERDEPVSSPPWDGLNDRLALSFKL